jgi:hypothetical protein
MFGATNYLPVRLRKLGAIKSERLGDFVGIGTQAGRTAGKAAGSERNIGNHGMHGTGITTFIENGKNLETAAVMGNHASTRTTRLCDRRRDELTLDKVARV